MRFDLLESASRRGLLGSLSLASRAGAGGARVQPRAARARARRARTANRAEHRFRASVLVDSVIQNSKFKIQTLLWYDCGVKGASGSTAWLRTAFCLNLAFCILHCSVVSAQQLLDRVLARVDGTPITLTDVQAATGLGIIQMGSGDPIAQGTQQMLDRQLALTEVQRFPPPEPSPDSIARETARLQMNAGP